ncbi:MAG: alpha/beta hydrolase [Chloroflexi bacterium]|nr:alpha/beta hydrolase [Chloroflexota bacterium]MCC6892488.1 alpha/beta fold hydrolase [Anaerolineae bacterium]
MKENVVLLGTNQNLVGVVTEPDQTPAANMPAVILFNAGLTHRVGPNRIYVKLARYLTEKGMVVLRFDLSGVGDSSVRTDVTSMEAGVMDDAKHVMDYLERTRGTKQFFLMGHCGGALTSLGIATIDPRVIGIVMINAEGGDTQWDEYDRKRKLSAYYENYYGRGALTSSEKWKKVLTGKASYGSILRNIFVNILWHRISATFFKLKKTLFAKPEALTRPEVAALFANIPSLVERKTQILIIYSQGSSGLERTQLLLRDVRKKIGDSPRFKLEVMPRCDHTFTMIDSQQRLYHMIADWCFANKPTTT